MRSVLPDCGAAPNSLPAALVDRAVSTFLAAWNDDDEHTRCRYLATVWAADGVFKDPLVSLVGRNALAAYIAHCRAGESGCRFAVRGHIGHHHDHLHLRWSMHRGPGQPALAGSSFGQLDGNGFLLCWTAFFDPTLVGGPSAQAAWPSMQRPTA